MNFLEKSGEGISQKKIIPTCQRTNVLLPAMPNEGIFKRYSFKRICNPLVFGIRICNPIRINPLIGCDVSDYKSAGTKNKAI